MLMLHPQEYEIKMILQNYQCMQYLLPKHNRSSPY